MRVVLNDNDKEQDACGFFLLQGRNVYKIYQRLEI